jgi:ketopantoate hydroxymethyltransferase
MTVADIRALKGKRKLSMLFVDTVEEAEAANQAGIDMLSIIDPVWNENMRQAAGNCFVQVGLLYGKLVTEEDYLDVLGYTRGHKPRHAKTYRNFRAEYDRLQAERVAAFGEFIADVNSGAYPAPEHIVPMADAEYEKFIKAIS